MANQQFKFYAVAVENRNDKGDYERSSFIHSIQPSYHNAQKVCSAPGREGSRLGFIPIPLGPKNDPKGQRMLEEALVLSFSGFINDKYGVDLDTFLGEALDRREAHLASIRKKNEDED